MQQSPGNVRAWISEKIASTSGLPLPSAVEAERGAFNSALVVASANGIPKTWADPRFVDVYRDRAMAVLLNLTPDNPALLADVSSGRLRPRDLASMSPDDLCPEKSGPRNLDFVVRLANTYHYKPAASSSEFRCRKCGERKCNVSEAQTRSADEGASLFVTCIGCGHRWRS